MSAHSNAHQHGHAHAHGHCHGADQPAFIAALAVTLGYAGIELAGGIWSGSLALASDAGHMLSYAHALGLAAIAAWISRRQPGLKHSYGIARAEVIGATLNGLLMLGVIVILVV